MYIVNGKKPTTILESLDRFIILVEAQAEELYMLKNLMADTSKVEEVEGVSDTKQH